MPPVKSAFVDLNEVKPLPVEVPSATLKPGPEKSLRLPQSNLPSAQGSSLESSSAIISSSITCTTHHK